MKVEAAASSVTLRDCYRKEDLFTTNPPQGRPTGLNESVLILVWTLQHNVELLSFVLNHRASLTAAASVLQSLLRNPRSSLVFPLTACGRFSSSLNRRPWWRRQEGLWRSVLRRGGRLHSASARSLSVKNLDHTKWREGKATCGREVMSFGFMDVLSDIKNSDFIMSLFHSFTRSCFHG